MNEDIERARSGQDASGSSCVIGHPEDVVRDRRLTTDEKRATLAEWASDAHAVENAPALRQLDDGSIVRLDDILRALKSLGPSTDPARVARWRPAPRRRDTLLSRLRDARPGRDDDDDPPPCPASASLPIRWRRIQAIAAA